MPDWPTKNAKTASRSSEANSGEYSATTPASASAAFPLAVAEAADAVRALAVRSEIARRASLPDCICILTDRDIFARHHGHSAGNKPGDAGYQHISLRRCSLIILVDSGDHLCDQLI